MAHENNGATLEIALVAPQIWNPIAEKEFSDLTQRERSVATAILSLAHSRHVGMTPELAAELAITLVGADFSPADGGAWQAVFNRLLKELAEGWEEQGALAATPTGLGMLMRASPTYTIIRLAIPLVYRACQSIELCYLYCADGVDASVTADDYADYAVDLYEELRVLAEDKDKRFALFWQECALVLTSLSSVNRPLDHQDLAEIDPAALGMLLRLKPDMQSAPSRLPRVRRVTRFRHQESRREREGGVKGIHVSHRIGDLGDMLLSEYLNDPHTRADRLLNTGFFAFERPPKRVKLRDVLIAAIMPGDLRQRLVADFVAACWFECMARFGWILLQSNLRLSEFRWIEGDQQGRQRHSALLLNEMPNISYGHDTEAPEPFRHTFLNALRWLPSFLDSRAPYTENGKSGHSWQDWLANTWTSQAEDIRWAIGAADALTGKSRPLQLESFSTVHTQLFLPSSLREQHKEINPATLLGRLNGRLLGSRVTAGSVSITWVPDLIDEGQWIIDVRGRAEPQLFDSKLHGSSESRLAGWLIRNWLEQFLAEIHQG